MECNHIRMLMSSSYAHKHTFPEKIVHVDHRRCQRARGGPHERRHRDESTPTANSSRHWLLIGA
jgi:hypothetical protein